MGNPTLIYKVKLEKSLEESFTHLHRLNVAFTALKNQQKFPIESEAFNKMVNDPQNLAFVDQIIYRFSKLQDNMGAKLFKAFLLYQGENINKPFLDILNELERLDILEVDEWFELRDIRNEIAHDYDEGENRAMDIINAIYHYTKELQDILEMIQKQIIF